MKKSKRFLSATVAAAAAAGCAFGFAACAKDAGTTDGNNGDEHITAVYAMYAETASANGENVLTYEQWLASIKGEKGDKGDKGDKGEKGDKGDKGDAGETGVSIVGIYETSAGLVIKLSDGTYRTAENGGAQNPLLKVGDNSVTLPLYLDQNVEPERTPYSFYLLEGGTYECRFSYDLCVYYDYLSPNPNGSIDVSKGSYDPYEQPAAGKREDGTDYWAVKLKISPEYVHTISLANYSDTETEFLFTIVKVSE